MIESTAPPLKPFKLSTIFFGIPCRYDPTYNVNDLEINTAASVVEMVFKDQVDLISIMVPLEVLFHRETGEKVKYLILPGTPKNCPYLSCYFSKSVFYLLICLKEICYTIMLNLEWSTCFISVTVRRFSIIIFLKSRIPEKCSIKS